VECCVIGIDKSCSATFHCASDEVLGDFQSSVTCEAAEGGALTPEEAWAARSTMPLMQRSVGCVSFSTDVRS
jgi:hypothetical protein